VKIAVVVRVYSSSGGGLERHAVSLVKGLIQRGHDVHLFAQRWDQPEDPRIHYHLVPVVRKPAWLQALLFHRGVNRHLKRADFDVVLGLGVVLFWPQHVYGLDGGLMADWLRLRYPSSLIRFAMAVIRPILLVNWVLERRLMKGNVSWVMVNSSRYQTETTRWYGVPSARIQLIYSGYDPARFGRRRLADQRRTMRQRHGVHDDAIVLLFVAHNFSLKGLGLLISALPSVLQKNPRTWLVVVGKGSPGPFLNMAKRHGVDRRVIFAGTTNAVDEYYAMADVLVHPTRYDPFATVCLEAMACGLPVVTTRINGASEIIRDGVNGYVIEDAGDLNALTDRIHRLLNPAHRDALGNAAAEAVRQYTFDRHLLDVERFFERVRKTEAPAKQLRASIRIIDQGMYVNEDYRLLLQQHGLHHFEALMGYEEGVIIKHQKGKRVFQLRLVWNGDPVVFYLKRHRQSVSIGRRLLRLTGRRLLSEGRKEWEYILAFHDRLLPTMTPVAMGERMLPGGFQESFVLTRGLEEFEPLESLAPKRFAPPLSVDRIKEKRTLIRAIAELTTTMHWHGFYHRDYYSPHLMLLKQGRAFEPDIKLIDLQRVLKSPWLSHRWMVKDLASVHFSFGGLGLTRTDKLRFLRAYSPVAARDRALMKAIMRKTKKIALHDERIRAR